MSSTSLEPHARITGPSDGNWFEVPNIGSYVSWSTIVWRTYWRMTASEACEASGKNTEPTTLSDSGWPKKVGEIRVLISARSPGSRSLRTWTVEPITTAGFSSTSVDALRTDPLRKPSTSWRSASMSGTVAGVSARTARSEATPTERSRTRDGLPCRMSSPPAVASPPKNSPLTGEDRRAPPGTASWYVSRVGEKTPR